MGPNGLVDALELARVEGIQETRRLWERLLDQLIQILPLVVIIVSICALDT